MCLYKLICKLWPASNIARPASERSRLGKHEMSLGIKSIQKICSTGAEETNMFHSKRKLYEMLHYKEQRFACTWFKTPDIALLSSQVLYIY